MIYINVAEFCNSRIAIRNVFNDIVWMENGTFLCFIASVQQVLQQHFDNRIITCNNAISWPTRCPVFTSIYFCFFSYLKSKVYTLNARNLSGSKYSIKRDFIQIPSAMLYSALWPIKLFFLARQKQIFENLSLSARTCG